MGKILIQLELGSNGFSYCMMDEHIMGTIKYFMAALKKKPGKRQMFQVKALICFPVLLAHGLR